MKKQPQRKHMMHLFMYEYSRDRFFGFLNSFSSQNVKKRLKIMPFRVNGDGKVLLCFQLIQIVSYGIDTQFHISILFRIIQFVGLLFYKNVMFWTRNQFSLILQAHFSFKFNFLVKCNKLFFFHEIRRKLQFFGFKLSHSLWGH